MAEPLHGDGKRWKKGGGTRSEELTPREQKRLERRKQRKQARKQEASSGESGSAGETK